MPLIIRLGGRADRMASPFTGTYLVDFDPARILTHADGTEEYVFTVTDDKREARKFKAIADAVEYYMQDVGTRTDGHPDRPLLEFNFTVQEL